jgi:hypothetical protein
MQRWYVDWQDNQGQRRRAIKESSLALLLMRHTHIKAPTALGQSILVVVGTHKGKTGQTVAQVGERLGGGVHCWLRFDRLCIEGHHKALCCMALCPYLPVPLVAHFPLPLPCSPYPQVGPGFTCQLDGLKGRTHCPADTLHATGEPPADRVLQSFEPAQLAKELAVGEVPGWLAAYQSDGNVDLRRTKPDSHVRESIFTHQRCPSILSDEEACRLHYAATGGLQGSGGMRQQRQHDKWALEGRGVLLGHYSAPSSPALAHLQFAT